MAATSGSVIVPVLVAIVADQLSMPSKCVLKLSDVVLVLIAGVM
jgi:hypothetical protein